jgi:centrosomal protein CEP19
MPLRNFNKHSGVQRVAKELRQNSRHARYLELLPVAQLEKLISMIHDHLNGMNRQVIIDKARTLDRIDPEEDLNKVDETTLNFKKAVMDKTFEKNRKRLDDPDFKYDVEVDFGAGAVETCEWDSDDKDDDGF